MKVALVYDRVNKWGGAERVLLALHKIFPTAPIFTSVYESRRAEWANKFIVKTSFLQKIPFARKSHEYLATFMPVAFESMIFDDYDVVISVTSEAAKGIMTKPETLHISICLTPTRYLWSGYKDYFKSKILKTVAAPAVRYLRQWDLFASSKADYIVAISKTVQNRIKRFYGRESVLIYPPLQLLSKSAKNTKSHGYFLVVSRFVSYKRIDIAIEAANKLKLPLKIVGSGAQWKKLKAMAGPTVEFIGHVSDKELINYYKHCKALIFPGLEDFGLTMVEAQSFGKPVIAYRGGGAEEIVIEGKTGEFFDEQTSESLVKTLKKFNKTRYNKNDCIENSMRFSFKNFKNEFLSFLRKAMLEFKSDKEIIYQ